MDTIKQDEQVTAELRRRLDVHYTNQTLQELRRLGCTDETLMRYHREKLQVLQTEQAKLEPSGSGNYRHLLKE